MSSIDYEAEVKKVYEGAEVKPFYVFDVALKYFIEDSLTGNQLSKTEFEPSEAWQSAYETLKT